MQIKYPRTHHVPWSLGRGSDDKVHETLDFFQGQEVIVTEKLDGENATVYPDGYTHARSMDSGHHESRSWLKSFAATFAFNIPQGWRICGENLYAEHSIHYDRLETYFYVFAIFDQDNNALSWDDLVEWCGLLGLKPVPVLYRGIWDEALIKSFWEGRSTVGEAGEGYVIRLAQGYAFKDFGRSVAKWVRAGHVQTDEHWKERPVIPNGLVSGS